MTIGGALPDLIVESLPRHLVDPLFPLMKTANPLLNPAGWRRHAGLSTLRAGRGVLVARQSTSGVLSGAVCYRRDHTLRHGAILTAENLVTLGDGHTEAACRALLGGLDMVAARLAAA